MLKVIKCSDNPSEYSFEDLLKSLQGNDEFSIYKTKKYVEKEKEIIRENLKKGVVKKEEKEWN